MHIPFVASFISARLWRKVCARPLGHITEGVGGVCFVEMSWDRTRARVVRFCVNCVLVLSCLDAA